MIMDIAIGLGLLAAMLLVEVLLLCRIEKAADERTDPRLEGLLRQIEWDCQMELDAADDRAYARKAAERKDK